MTNEKIIDGLKFTVDMCLFSPTDGSKRPVSMLNDMDKITYNACEGAIQALEQQRWIPVGERLPEENVHVLCQFYMGGMAECYRTHNYWHIVGGFRIQIDEVIAWKPLPQPYKEEQDVKNNTDND